MKTFLKKTGNYFPQLKKKVIDLLDTYADYKKIVLGYLVRFPSYYRNRKEAQVLAKPGVLGFNGGAFNPGAIHSQGKMILLAKATHVPWYNARGKKRDFFLKGSPLLFTLNPNLSVRKKVEIISHFKGFPENHPWAIEDMRLFTFRNSIYINHSLVEFGNDDSWFGQGSVSASLSILNIEEQSISFNQVPQLDFPKQKIEKNWMYLEHDHQLYLFYSLNPYRVLVQQDGVFVTKINQDLEGKLKDIGGFGTMVSQSTNPIDFDKDHYMMVIHQIEPKKFGRCYHHWILLISKQTLLPVKITAQPIFSGLGARGRTPGIRYISSILKEGDEILFFAGEGDIYVTINKKPVKDIIKRMIDLEC